MAETYRIVRFYQGEGTRRRIIKTGLSLQEAQEHCSDPKTSSRTRAKSPAQEGKQWFDGYEKE